MFLELYLVEIAILTAFTYLLYRLTKVLVVHRLPASPRPRGEPADDEAAETRD